MLVMDLGLRYLSLEASESLVQNMTFDAYILRIALRYISKFDNFRNDQVYWLKKSENQDEFIKSFFLAYRIV